MKAKDVILAILIIIFGISIKYFRYLKDEIGSIFSERETFHFEEKFFVESKEHIQIEGERTAIFIEGWDGDKIEGKIIKSVSSRSKEDAENISKEIVLTREVKENIVKFKIKEPFQLNMDFFNFKFPVSDTTLNFKVSFRSAIKIVSENSDIEISEVKNSVNIENSHGDVKIKNCEGNFYIKNSHGETEIKDLKGDLKIFSPHSSISIENASNAEIEGGFEKIYMKNLKNLKLITEFSPVEVYDLEGEIFIKNKHSKLFIRDSKIRGKVEGEGLEIEGENLSSNDLKIENSYEPIILNNFSGKAKIYSKYNEVEISLIEGSDLDVECKYSDIKINLDNKWKGEIYADAYEGQIVGSRLPVIVENKGARKVLKANLEGDNRISLKTTYGKIQIAREEN